MKIGDLPTFGAADYLQSSEDRASFLAAAVEDGDPVIFRRALQAAVRSMETKNTPEAAERMRQHTDRLAEENASLTLATVIDVLKSIGLRIAFSTSWSVPATSGAPIPRAALALCGA